MFCGCACFVWVCNNRFGLRVVFALVLLVCRCCGGLTLMLTGRKVCYAFDVLFMCGVNMYVVLLLGFGLCGF